MEIEGRLVSKLAVQTGTSAKGPWAKQEFVIEFQEGNFPSKLCLNVWGEDKVKELEGFQVGDKLKVSFNLSSREYNGKWYTDVRAWRISRDSAGAPAAPQGGMGSQSVPAGFTSTGPQVAPMPTVDDIPENDLPF